MIKKWLLNPNRSFNDGLKLYNQIKSNSDFDGFFATADKPNIGSLEFNYLENELKNYVRVFGDIKAEKPVNKAIDKIVDKIEISNTAIKKAGIFPISTKTLFFDSNVDRIDINTLPDDLKVLYNENKKLIQEKGALHAQLKALTGKANADKRSNLSNKIDDIASDLRSNWDKIDSYIKNPQPSTTTALSLAKKIDAARKYISRNINSTTPKVIAEIQIRKTFLKEQGIEWKQKTK
jgi:hypothetical protein